MVRTTNNPWRIIAIGLALIALVALSALATGLLTANRSLREVERTPALVVIGRPTQEATRPQPTTPQPVGSRSVRQPDRTAAAPRPKTEAPTQTPGATSQLTALSSASADRTQRRETKLPSKKVSARVETIGLRRVEGP
jgi:hypothetical protein